MVQSNQSYASFQEVVDAYRFSEQWENLTDSSKVAYRKPIERLLELYKVWASQGEARSPKQLPVAVARSRSLPEQRDWNRLVRSLPVSNAEKNKTFIVLNSVYQGAELGRMKFKAMDHTVKETEPWTKEEIEILWTASLTLRLRLAVCFLRFCFYSGLRPWCEASVMEKGAISGDLVLVMGSKRREKDAVARMVKMLPEMKQCLEFANQMAPHAGTSSLVWVLENGRAVKKDTIRNRLMEVCKSLGVQFHEMYDARRGLGTAMLRQGYTLQDVAYQLGHKNLETTKRYDQRSMTEKAVQFKGV